MKKGGIVAAAVAVGVVLLIVLTNFIFVHSQMRSVLASDERNRGISVWAYYAYGLPSDSIVFDLRDVANEKSQLDITRVLLQFSAKMKMRDFDVVYLAWRGERKFLFDGQYFKELGLEYDSQNPIYTIRTMPENVRTLDGGRAYSSWSGGWLGVLNKQLEDSNQFHKDWYLDDLLAE